MIHTIQVVFPIVQITVDDGHKYYCNLDELNYIHRIIYNQKNNKYS